MITAAFLTFLAAAMLGNLGSQSGHYAGLIACAGWFFACRALPERGWRWLLSAALGLSVAVAALAVVQVALWMPRARGPFVSPNFLGAYAVLMFFLAAGGQLHNQSSPPTCSSAGGASLARRNLVPAANLLTLALSQSRGALLALGAGLLCGMVVATNARRLAICGLIVATILAALLIRSGNEESRIGIWRLGLQAGMLRPLTGWGVGGLSVDGLDRFYSIPIEWFTNAGILGVLAGAWLLSVAWWRAKNEPAIHAFLAAWCVQGLFLGGTPATNLLLVTVLAWLASVRRDVSDCSRRIDDDQPFLDRRVRADRA